MKLGFLVTNDNNQTALLGLAQAALRRGWSLRLFFNDAGTRLLEHPEVNALAETAAISFCEYSARKLGVKLEGLHPKIKKGTQLNHAFLQQQSDKVIVL